MPGTKAKEPKPEFVPEQFTPPAEPGFPMVVTLPIKTMSEANRTVWQQKSSRIRSARGIVSKFFGRNMRHLLPFAEAYHGGRTVYVTLTRIGGPKLDALANLGASLKGVEDAVALMLGADDGCPLFRSRAEQEPKIGGPCGVRIELSLTV